MIKSAVLSPCGQFRYVLEREWRLAWQVRRRINFVMLNPSTADATYDDATIRKCIGFAARLGFNHLRVVNLFAYRTTKPIDLVRNGYLQGPRNRHFLDEVALDSAINAPFDPVVLAWGAVARGMPQMYEVVRDLQAAGAHLFTLSVLTDGTPAHPLYLPNSCRLTPYSQK